MITYQELYGADADNHRGYYITEHEIEPSDFDDIHAQVLDLIADLDKDDEIPDEMEVTLICPISDEDIQFTITTKDYQ